MVPPDDATWSYWTNPYLWSFAWCPPLVHQEDILQDIGNNLGTWFSPFCGGTTRSTRGRSEIKIKSNLSILPPRNSHVPDEQCCPESCWLLFPSFLPSLDSTTSLLSAYHLFANLDFPDGERSSFFARRSMGMIQRSLWQLPIMIIIIYRNSFCETSISVHTFRLFFKFFLV